MIPEINPPMASMPKILLKPTANEFPPGKHITLECLAAMNTDKHRFLYPEEVCFIHHIICLFKDKFAWNKSEKGIFCEDYFPPVEIPVISHKPWVLKNIPIPQGLFNQCKDNL